MKSLTVITALPLTTEIVDQITLKDEDLLVPIGEVRSTVDNCLPLTGVLGRLLLTPELTQKIYGPWLKIYVYLENYDNTFTTRNSEPQLKLEIIVNIA